MCSIFNHFNKEMGLGIYIIFCKKYVWSPSHIDSIYFLWVYIIHHESWIISYDLEDIPYIVHSVCTHLALLCTWHYFMYILCSCCYPGVGTWLWISSLFLLFNLFLTWNISFVYKHYLYDTICTYCPSLHYLFILSIKK